MNDVAPLKKLASSAPKAGPAPAKRSTKYPAPLIVPPLSGCHKQTFIVLHGRGSTNRRFAPALVEYPVALPPQKQATSTQSTSPTGSNPPSPTFNITNLQTQLPYTRFVFPGASTRRATTFARSNVSQWFDMNPLTEPTENEHLMVEGLQGTTDYLHGLIEREAKLAGGAGNVVLGGLSQGCASSLIAMLLWKGEPLKAFVGMAGWLPFCEHLQGVSSGSRKDWEPEPEEEHPEDAEVDNPFANDSDGDSDSTQVDDLTTAEQAVKLLRDELGLADTSILNAALGRTPVFMGHGVEDEKVPCQLGKDAAKCLSTLGFNVSHREYDELGHWYSDKMLGDIVTFLGNTGASRVSKPPRKAA